MRKVAIAIASAAIFVSGCASIVTGTDQVINVNSNTAGADVLVDGVLVGQTPFNGKIKKGSSTSLTVRKEGYQERTVQLATELEGAFWGNILIGGVVGSTTDSVSGGMHRYAPNTIQIDLQQTAGK